MNNYEASTPELGFLNNNKNLSLVLVHVPRVGEVHFRRNTKARRLTITIKPQKRVFVTYPGFVSYNSAVSFVESKAEWIKAKLNLQPDSIPLTNLHPFYTQNHKLVFSAEARLNILVKVSNGFISVRHPNTLNETDSVVQQAARRGVDLAYRKEAHEYLPEKVSEHAKRLGIVYSKVSIKRTTSRWGSCSAAGNINLSIYLMKLPNHLIDYIIVHELAHIKVKNHRKEFWSYLDMLIGGNAKVLAKELKKYRAEIHQLV